MPLVRVVTNQKPSPELDAALTALLAQAFHKDPSWVMVVIDPPPARMTFKGSAEPCCYLEVKNIGLFDAAIAESLSAELSRTIQRALGVPPERVYIEFSNPRPPMGLERRHVLKKLVVALGDSEQPVANRRVLRRQPTPALVAAGAVEQLTQGGQKLAAQEAVGPRERTAALDRVAVPAMTALRSASQKISPSSRWYSSWRALKRSPCRSSALKHT